MLGPETFRFLNHEAPVAEPGDWNRDDCSLLWLYHLHYFDDLNADGSEARSEWHRALIQRWIDDNPPGQRVGWAPYPTSLRIVNWIKWPLSGQALSSEALHSLAIQVRWLRRRLEIHLLGNHLWANAKALIFAGTFFEGGEADSWRRKGLSLIRRELDEQILADGGHFERSPMYHAIVLEDLLDLVQLAQSYPAVIPVNDVAEWREYVKRMLRWLERMSHPDGEIAFFNDAALDVAPNDATLNDYAAALGLGGTESTDGDLIVLDTSGYVRMEDAASVLICDTGTIGPDYLPGHAHADTLSFEMSVYGQRVLVNSGTNCYEDGPDRLYQRGTRAHNAVVVDDQNSSEVWSSFRVACRAYPQDLQVNQDGQETVVACSHDGYRRLPGRVIHRRTWRLKTGSLLVSDELSGKFGIAVARFHFHPDVNVTLDASGNSGEMRLPTGQSIDFKVEAGLAELEQTEYYPRFGHTYSNWCLAVTLQDARSQVVFTWN